MGNNDYSDLGCVNGNRKQWLNLTDILAIEFIGHRLIFPTLGLAVLGLWRRILVKV